MKIILNKCHNHFDISYKAFEALNYDREFWMKDSRGSDGAYLFELWDKDEDNNYMKTRTDPRLIKMMEDNPYETQDYYSNLVVVEIPDEASDWQLVSSSFYERIVYVVDGKLYWK